MNRLKYLKNIIIPFLVALFNIIIIFYPKEVITASKQGVDLWFQNVLPSLLPFLIGANLLVALGFVNFVGTILEPLMYKIFGVPGISGFPLICGMTSGYPIGAKITSELREKEMITKEEGQRIISFTNNSGPLFIIGVVGVSMFHNIAIGYFILLLHYLGAIATGLTFKYYKQSPERKIPTQRFLLRKSVRNMIQYQKKEGKSFPIILATSVKNAMETILFIGGFIILFSVIIKILDIFTITTYIDNIIKNFTSIYIDPTVLKGFFYGLLEITNGCKILATNGSTSNWIISCVAAIISFGGLCIQFQSITFIAKTDLSIGIYIFSKMLHALYAFIFGMVLFPFFSFEYTEAMAVFGPFDTSFSSKFLFSTRSFLYTIGGILLLVLIYHLCSSAFYYAKRHTYSRRRRSKTPRL